jgi:hypothetical protein
MGDVFDLNVLRREVEGEPFVFRLGVEEFELPIEMDQRAALLFGAADRDPSKAEQAFRLMLGDDQWARLLAVPEVLTLDMLVALMAAYGEHVGATVGESQASPQNSNRAARRSKQPSRPRTISA